MFKLYDPLIERAFILASKIENSLASNHLNINFLLIGFEIRLYPNLLEVDNTLRILLSHIFFLVFVIFQDPFFKDKVPLLPCFENIWALLFEIILMRIIGSEHVFSNTWPCYRYAPYIKASMDTIDNKSTWQLLILTQYLLAKSYGQIFFIIREIFLLTLKYLSIVFLRLSARNFPFFFL